MTEIGLERESSSAVRIGALAPLSPPGWVDAGRHLVEGMIGAADQVNRAGGIGGREVELVIRDTAGNAAKAVSQVRALAAQGVGAFCGEFHSNVAKAVARECAQFGLTFMCASAVIDSLVAETTPDVGRIAPPQTAGWTRFAEFLLRAGHRRMALLKSPGDYWTAGAAIIDGCARSSGGTTITIEVAGRSPENVVGRLCETSASVALLLTDFVDPTIPMVRAIVRSGLAHKVSLAAPAGQPELATWWEQLGDLGLAIPFLRYMPKHLPHCVACTSECSSAAHSFVRCEGHDAVTALCAVLERRLAVDVTDLWPELVVPGCHGPFSFSRSSDGHHWQRCPTNIGIFTRDPDDGRRMLRLE